jgi:adenylate cyclase
LLVGSLFGYGGSVGFRLRTAAPAGKPIAGEMTFLVASTQDLSAQADVVSPAHAGTALLTYIHAVRSSVEAHGGTVASVSGETVTAVFTPANGQAVDAALAVTERVAAGTKSVDSSPIRAVAAVHTGPGIVAPPSEFGRMVLGDGVSRATRICRLAVYYGVDVLVSADDEDRGLVFLDAVTFGDRPDIVRVYVPLRSAGDQAAEFSRARAEYEQRSFAQAKERFSAIQATVGHPLAGAAARFAARCDRFLASPPPPQWNGVWRVGDQTYMSTRRPT